MSLKAPPRPANASTETKVKTKSDPKVAKKPPAAAVAKLHTVKQWAATRVVGRKDVIDATILAVAARQNVCMIGSPGTAKTLVVQLVASSFADQPGDVFDIMLTKFTKPAEMFGPVDLRELEKGKYHYLTDGYAPAARVVIVDEVFKGSSAIMNANLRMANERTFKNGNVDEQCPLRTMIGMSNEFPEEPALLAAFFDRFPIKLLVKYLEPDDFQSMLRVVADGNAAKTPCPVTITEADFVELDALIDACEVSDDVVDSLAQLREMVKAKSVSPSDRRYAQALRVLKAHAVLNGRDRVSLNDFAVLESVLWNSEPEIPIIKSILPDFVSPFERNIKEITDDVYAERQKVIEAANVDGADKNRQSPDYVAAGEVAGKAISRVRTYLNKLEIIEDATSGDVDQELISAARESIQEIDKVLKLILTGKADGVKKLIETTKLDLTA